MVKIDKISFSSRTDECFAHIFFKFYASLLLLQIVNLTAIRDVQPKYLETASVRSTSMEVSLFTQTAHLHTCYHHYNVSIFNKTKSDIVHHTDFNVYI